MMYESIIHFPKQFEYNPRIENSDKLKRFKKFLVCGMGGSHLAANFIKVLDPKIDIAIHSDYGLPNLADLKQRLVVCSSHSGNTEEVVDSLFAGHKQKLSVAVIATGGKLLKLAKHYSVPYVELPITGDQPRMAIGHSILGHLALMGEKKLLGEFQTTGAKLKPKSFESLGKRLALDLKGFVPVICSSNRNHVLAYYWKITLNETAKLPAFCNVFPEFNHNEMEGYDVFPKKSFHVVFLSDKADHPRIQKRMNVTAKLLRKRNVEISFIPFRGKSFDKIFSTIFLASWTAYHLAKLYSVNSDMVPLIEEFKKTL